MISGVVTVLPGAADSGNGSPNEGISAAAAGPYNGGMDSVHCKQHRSFLQQLVVGLEADLC